ncbi:MAG: IS1182 family transposase [Pseudomonadota bacterium]
MMGGRQVMQDSLFYEFNLERHVPEGHLLRAIDQISDFGFVREHLEPFYSSIGRPSVDPELMVRMLIVGYCFGIRSERRLCQEVHLNLAYRWFCKLGLEGEVPDHSTFSKNRHGRFRESGLFREVFETIVRQCIADGLVGGDGFAVDASTIEANANRGEGDFGTEPLPPEVMHRRAVQEYFDTLDDAAFGAASELPPKYLSPVDPASRWTRTFRSGRAYYSYSLNYLVDCANAIIVDVEGSTAIRPAELTVTRRMIERVKERHGIMPRKLMGDTAYGSAAMLHWLVEDKDIEPHIPVLQQRQRTDGVFARNEFKYYIEADHYICPGGKELKRFRTKGRAARSVPSKDGTHRYYAKKSDCSSCNLKPWCCPKEPLRKIPRSIHENARDYTRRIAETEEFISSRNQRKKVEMLFAHLKSIMKFGQLRLRGPTGINDEFLLAAIAQNLRKMAKLHSRRLQPSPA